MTLDQKIADLSLDLERVETQQARILLMLNLFGLDDAVLKETKDSLDARLNELAVNGMVAHARMNELQAQMSRLGAGR